MTPSPVRSTASAPKHSGARRPSPAGSQAGREAQLNRRSRDNPGARRLRAHQIEGALNFTFALLLVSTAIHIITKVGEGFHLWP